MVHLLAIFLLGPAPAIAAPAESPQAPAYVDRVTDVLEPVAGGLTADSVAERAVASAPTIEQRRAELRRTAASVDRTMAAFLPNVGVTASYTRVNPLDIDFGGDFASVGALNEGPLIVIPCPGDTTGLAFCVADQEQELVGAARVPPFEIPVDNYSLQASLSVPLSDYALRLIHAKRGAESEARAGELSRDAEAVQVEQDARLAYYDWLRSLAQVAVADQAVDSVGARLADAKVLAGAGVMTEADVLRLDGLLAAAEVGLLQARDFASMASDNLSVIMGGEFVGPYSVGEDVMAPMDTSDWTDRRALVDEAATNRLELRAMDQSLDALGHGVKAARAAYYPRLDGFGDLTYANPNQRFFPASNQWNASWTVGLSLSWQLGQFMNARAQAKEVAAGAGILAAQRASVRRAVEMEVTAAWHEHRRAEQSVALRQRALASTLAAYGQVVTRYRGGEATTTDVVEAEGERLNATLQFVNTYINLRAADVKLRKATGRMKPRAVEEDPSPS